MRGFDVVTEQDQGDEQVVDVGFVYGQENHGHILLKRRFKKKPVIFKNGVFVTVTDQSCSLQATMTPIFTITRQ